jgi:hypothetical protein
MILQELLEEYALLKVPKKRMWELLKSFRANVQEFGEDDGTLWIQWDDRPEPVFVEIPPFRHTHIFWAEYHDADQTFVWSRNEYAFKDYLLFFKLRAIDRGELER